MRSTSSLARRIHDMDAIVSSPAACQSIRGHLYKYSCEGHSMCCASRQFTVRFIPSYNKRSKTRLALDFNDHCSRHVVLREERHRTEPCPRKNEDGADGRRAAFVYRFDLFGRAERVGHANERVRLRLIPEEGAARQEKNFLTECFLVD